MYFFYVCNNISILQNSLKYTNIFYLLIIYLSHFYIYNLDFQMQSMQLCLLSYAAAGLVVVVDPWYVFY